MNNPKIGPQREGPFLISDVLGPLTYQLELPSNWRIHNVFHVVLLRPYIENEIHGANFPWPPPLNFLKEKRFMKWSQSLNTEDEAEDTNIF